MTRAKLEKYIGKRVEAALFDGDVVKGILHRTGEEIFKNDLNLYIPKNYYVCTNDTNYCSCLFRVSHIKRIGAIT